MLLLIIGPSAVGKTATTRKYAEKYGNCTLLNLDDAVAQLNGTETAFQTVKQYSWEKFFQDCQLIIILNCETNNTSDSLTLIDAGEGVLWREVSRELLSQYKRIALVATPEDIFQRRHGELNWSLEDAYKYSFSEERMKYFQQAEAVIDCNGLSIEQVVDKMTREIQALYTFD